MGLSKEELKDRFSEGSIPSESDFHDLIDGIVGEKGDRGLRGYKGEKGDPGADGIVSEELYNSIISRIEKIEKELGIESDNN